MRKVFGWLLIGLVLTGIILVGALPRYAPPIVERLVTEEISSFGFDPDVRMDLGYHWRGGPSAEGSLRLALPNSPWCLRTRFKATLRGWSFSARLPETAFDQDDRTLQTLHRRFPTPAISNLTYSGSIALEAGAEGGYLWSPPRWFARVPVRNVSASLFVEDKPIAIEGLSLTPAVTGIVSHDDIRPLFVRARSISFREFNLTNFHASVRASEHSLLLTEAGAGFCGGKVALYSLFLDTKSLNAGFTLFADDIDAGEAMHLFNGFKGDASGRLHGKIRLFVREGGRAVRLHDAFLYSTPGETGKLHLEDSDRLTENLAYAGIDSSTQANVANALTDLDYSALKLTLRRQGDKSATLTTHVNGTATRGKVTVPVNLTLNFHGDIEQLINLGLDYNNKLKGNKKQ